MDCNPADQQCYPLAAMASAADAFLKYGCPGIGAGVAFIVFFSPMKAILEVNRRKYLGVSAYHLLCPSAVVMWCM